MAVKENKLQFKKATIVDNEEMTIMEYDAKGENVLNEESLMEAFKEVVDWAKGIPEITFVIHAKKESANE